MGQLNFKKHFKFHNFSEIIYCGMARPGNTNLSVFMQYHYTITILRNKNMGQSLFKKHLKFQNFHEIFYCGMTRLRNTNLDVFIQCQYTRAILRNINMGQSLFKKPNLGMLNQVFLDTKAILRKENMGQDRFQKLSKFQKFQLSNFTLTLSNEGKINSVRLDMTYSKEQRITAENENIGQTYLKKHLNYTIIVKYCVMAISRNSNRFVMGIEKSLSQIEVTKVYENIPIQPWQVRKVFSL